MQATNTVNTVPAAPSNYVNNQVLSLMGNQRFVRIRVPALNMQIMPNNQGTVRIQVPANGAQALQNVQGIIRLPLPAANGQAPPGSSSNPLRLN